MMYLQKNAYEVAPSQGEQHCCRQKGTFFGRNKDTLINDESSLSEALFDFKTLKMQQVENRMGVSENENLI